MPTDLKTFNLQVCEIVRLLRCSYFLNIVIKPLPSPDYLIQGSLKYFHRVRQIASGNLSVLAVSFQEFLSLLVRIVVIRSHAREAGKPQSRESLACGCSNEYGVFMLGQPITAFMYVFPGEN